MTLTKVSGHQPKVNTRGQEIGETKMYIFFLDYRMYVLLPPMSFDWRSKKIYRLKRGEENNAQHKLNLYVVGHRLNQTWNSQTRSRAPTSPWRIF